MLGVQDEHQVQQPRLFGRKFVVLAQHVQEVFRNGHAFLGHMNEQGFPVVIVTLDREGVRHDDGQTPNQLDGLADKVFRRQPVRIRIIGIQREHAAGELVHDVVARRLDDHILGKPFRQDARCGQDGIVAPQLLFRRQMAKKQQVGHLFVAKGSLCLMRFHQVHDVDAPVEELARFGRRHAVNHLITAHAADLGDARDDARAVGIAQAALDALVIKLLRTNLIFRADVRAQAIDIAQKLFIDLTLHVYSPPLPR